MINTVINLIALAILVGDIFIVIFIFSLILKYLGYSAIYNSMVKFARNHSYHVVFAITFAGLLGSLFMSEIAKYPPCTLCWYQRIAIYPQPLLLYVSFLRSEKVLTPYLIVLNVIGALIAIYHIIIQYLPQYALVPCHTGNISCTTVQLVYYGFITIPVMSLTAFLLNIIFLKLGSVKVGRK